VREEGQISQQQFAFLLTAFLVGRSTLLTPVGPAKQDGWLAVLMGALLAGIPALIWLALGQRFGRQSPVTYIRQTLGEFLGLPLVILYLWHFLHMGAGVARNMSEMYVTALMPETPILVFSAAIIFLAASSVRSGVECISRLAEILTPWLVLFVMSLNVLTLFTPNLAHWQYLKPILGSGWLNLLRGAFLSFAFPFSEAVVFGFVFPHLNDSRSMRRYTLVTMAFVAVLLSVTYVRNLVVLGPYEIAHLTFPSLTAVEQIDLGDFFQRLEPLIIFIWTFGGFLKLAILLYVVCLGSAQLLGLKDYRVLVLPFAILMTCLSVLIYENFAQVEEFYSTIYPLYTLPFALLLPALVLAIALIRGKLHVP
jgi:spore germination protein KB